MQARMVVNHGLGEGGNRELFNGHEVSVYKKRKFWRSVAQNCEYT